MDFVVKARRFFEGKLFYAFLVLLSACFVVFKWEAYGAIILLNIGAVALLFCENILSAFLPALLASTFVIKCYDSASLFLPLWWTALFPVAAIVAYLIIYKRKLTVGKSFWGILAVAVSVTLGGAFTLSPADYFSGASMYYVIMLGFGMLAAYLLIRSHVVENVGYDVFERFADMMLTVGAFASFVVFEHYVRNLQETLFVGNLADVQWSNNIATILMITMPFGIYKMKKGIGYIAFFVANYAAILLAASRGGWLMGTLEFCICLVVGIFFIKLEKPKKTLLSVFGILIVVGGLVGVFLMAKDMKQASLIIHRSDSRVNLFVRSFEDFLNNPVFGSGLGNWGNADIYDGKQGTITWYHMMIPQIVGSLGLVGIFCYGKQMVERFGMMFSKPSPYVLTLGLSYVGLLLMSQVNPGEFCPLPYELLAVVNFIMIEKYNEKNKEPT